jgi:hypothetical protein
MMLAEISTSSQLLDICEQIKLLQEQVESATFEPWESIADAKSRPKQETVDEIDTVGSLMESFSLSDSGSSAGLNDTEETVKDLKGHIDCLLDLVPALESPAKDLTLEDKMYILSEKNDMSAEARLFFAEIISRWPSTDELFARRLAEANWKRRERLRAKLLEVQGRDREEEEEEEEEAENEGPVISERSRASPWALSSPTSPSATNTSGLDHTAPSETSLATSFNEEDSNIIRRRIPQLPENHEWGTAFRCIVCGDTLRDVDSPARWKYVAIILIRVTQLTELRKHVFNDIQPYICSYSECANGVNTFVSQRAWVNHEFKIHRIDKHWYCFYCPGETFHSAGLCREHIQRTHEGTDYQLLTQEQLDDLIYIASRVQSQPANKQECPFCLTVVADTIPKFGAHVGQHMREIAIAAIPFSAHNAVGDDFETRQDEDSGVDETDSESDQLQMDQLSGLKRFDWMPDETSIPTLQSTRAAYDFSRGSPRCIGVPISRHRRCRVGISSIHVGEFLEASKELQKSGKAELSHLEWLASLVLCHRWHQSQASRIAHAWLAELKSNVVAESQSNSRTSFTVRFVEES